MSITRIDSYHRLRRICKGVDRDDLTRNKLYQVSKRLKSSDSEIFSLVGKVVMASPATMLLYLGWIPFSLYLTLYYTSYNSHDMTDLMADVADDIY